MRIGRALLTSGLAIGFPPILGADPAYACSFFADRNKKGQLYANLCGGTRPFDSDDQPYFAPGSKVR